MNGMYIVTMPDGTEWGVPIETIAWNRAEAYASEYGGDIEESLREDTYPLFLSDQYEIHDWAASNMNWDDVKAYAVLIVDHVPSATDHQEGWMNGKYRIERKD